MKDPVVLSEGLSYEKSALVARKTPMYPNRALKTVIDETVAASGKSLRANMMRIQRSMRNSLNNVWDKSLIPSPTEPHRPLPDVYYGPITSALIHDPVIDPEGNTFEKNALLAWIRDNGDSPLTRTPLSADVLFPNHAIRDLLDIEKGLRFVNSKQNNHLQFQKTTLILLWRENQRDNNNDDDDDSQGPTKNWKKPNAEERIVIRRISQFWVWCLR